MTQHSDVGRAWQEVVDGSVPLAQGDQLWGVPKIRPKAQPDGTWIGEQEILDVILLTQSCDIEQGKAREILTAPIYSIYDWIAATPSDLNRLEEIRGGRDISLFLLPSIDDERVPEAHDDRVADLANVQTLLPSILIAHMHARPRLALVPPVREHLSQAYARSIMRVGLDLDIPSYRLQEVPGSKSQYQMSSLQTENGALALSRPLAVKMRRRVRVATGNEFVLLQVELSGNMYLNGAGRDQGQAEESLAKDFLQRRDAFLDEGDTRYSDLVDYLPE